MDRLDGDGGISQYHIILFRGSFTIQYGREDRGSFLHGFPAMDAFGRYGRKAQLVDVMDMLSLVADGLEIARQGNFVVPIQCMEDGVLLIGLLVQVAVKARS